MILVAIRNGMFSIKNHDNEERDFPLTDEGREAFQATCEEWKIEEVMSSSSLDWPEDGGAPEDFGPEEAHAFLQYGLAWQPVRVSVCLFDLEEMVARLEREDTESVLNALKVWVADAHEGE
jgi:hypothetical protein